MREIEESVSQDLGFRLISENAGIPLFEDPVELSAALELPLQLLTVSHAKKLYAASNSHKLGIGHLSTFDHWLSSDTAIQDFVSVDFPGVTAVKFAASGNLLYALAQGTLFRAAVAEVLGKNASSFAKVSGISDIVSFDPSPVADHTFAFVTRSGDLHVYQDGTESALKGHHINGCCWAQDGSEIMAVQDLLVVVVSTAGMEKVIHPLEERGTLVSVSPLNDSLYYVVGLPGDDEEDEYHTSVKLSPDQELIAEALPLGPGFADAECRPTPYCVSLPNWLDQKTHFFITYSKTTEISTVVLGDDIEVVLPLNDNDRAELPIADDGTDTLPVGLALDVTGTEAVVCSPCAQIEEAVGVLPRLLCLNSAGHLLVWNVFEISGVRNGSLSLERPLKLYLRSIADTNKSIETSSEKQKEHASEASGALDKSFTESVAPTLQTGALAEGPTSFGSKPSTSSPFGSAPAFGATGFGQVKFGQSPFASKPAASNFGATTLNFGSKSGFGADASSADSPFAKLALNSQSKGDIFASPSTQETHPSSGTSSATENELGKGMGQLFGKHAPDFKTMGASDSFQKQTEKPVRESTFSAPKGSDSPFAVLKDFKKDLPASEPQGSSFISGSKTLNILSSSESEATSDASEDDSDTPSEEEARESEDQTRSVEPISLGRPGDSASFENLNSTSEDNSSEQTSGTEKEDSLHIPVGVTLGNSKGPVNPSQPDTTLKGYTGGSAEPSTTVQAGMKESKEDKVQADQSKETSAIKGPVYQGQVISEFIQNTKFEKFDGFSSKPELPDNPDQKYMTKLILNMQGHFEILAHNLTKLEDMFDAAGSQAEDSADIQQVANVSLSHVENLQKSIFSNCKTIKVLLQQYKVQDKQMQEIITKSNTEENMREQIEKLLSQLAAFKQAIVKNSHDKNQLDAPAAALRLKLRQKLARVEDLEKQAMEKLVPLGVQANLGDLNKFEVITHEIHYRTNEYAREVEQLKTEIAALALPDIRALTLDLNHTSLPTRVVAAERRFLTSLKTTPVRLVSPQVLE